MFFLDDAYYLKNCGCIPLHIADLTSLAYNAIRVVVPVVLILVGIVTLMSTLLSQKEDDIKKAQSKLVQKVIAAIVVFLVATLVRFAVSIVSGTMTTAQEDDLWECVNYMLTRENESKMNKVSESECKIIQGENPVIVAYSQTLKLNDSYDPLDGISANDPEDGDLTSKIIVISSNVDTSIPGNYTVSYEVTDSDGHKSVRNITVTVLGN